MTCKREGEPLPRMYFEDPWQAVRLVLETRDRVHTKLGLGIEV